MARNFSASSDKSLLRTRQIALQCHAGEEILAGADCHIDADPEHLLNRTREILRGRAESPLLELVDQISFVVLGLSTSNLTPNNIGNVVSVHFYSPGDGGSQSTQCPGPTGFAKGSAVPEPGTLTLLGTGLLGLGIVVRRRVSG